MAGVAGQGHCDVTAAQQEADLLAASVLQTQAPPPSPHEQRFKGSEATLGFSSHLAHLPGQRYFYGHRDDFSQQAAVKGRHEGRRVVVGVD